MTTVASLRGSAHEVTCSRCGKSLVAPEWAEYFSQEQLVLNLWTCMACGNHFETEAFVGADPDSKIDDKIVETFLPALLVA